MMHCLPLLPYFWKFCVWWCLFCDEVLRLSVLSSCAIICLLSWLFYFNCILAFVWVSLFCVSFTWCLGLVYGL